VKRILPILIVIGLLFISGCSVELPGETYTAGAEDQYLEDYVSNDAANPKLSFPYEPLFTMEDKESHMKTVPRKDGLLDIRPYAIGRFFLFNPDNDEIYLSEDDSGESFGFYEDFTGGCSVWEAVMEGGYREEWKATSTLAPYNGINYNAENLGSASRGAAWCEGAGGYGIGESVSVDKTITTVSGADIDYTTLCIVNGYAKSRELWKDNSRVKTLKMYLNGEPYAYISLVDIIKPQYFALYDIKVKSGETTRFRFEIVEVYEGEKYEDTCLTGIRIPFLTPYH